LLDKKKQIASIEYRASDFDLNNDHLPCKKLLQKTIK